MGWSREVSLNRGRRDRDNEADFASAESIACYSKGPC